MYERFAQLLKARGITPHTISKATGITSATFSSWKQGIYTPKLEKMQKIAEFLGVSVDYLMGRTETPNPTNIVAKPETPTFCGITELQPIFELQQKYTSLTEENQRALLEYADFLLYKQNKNRP